MTEEELEALAAAAGVKWKFSYIPIRPNTYTAYFLYHTERSYGETKQEAMNHYWNRYINGEVRQYSDDTSNKP